MFIKTDFYEFEKPNLPQSVADHEKQLSPEGIEALLSENLSPDRFNQAQQLIDQYSTEEALRRLRESDPEAARRLESQSYRDDNQLPIGDSPNGDDPP